MKKLNLTILTFVAIFISSCSSDQKFRAQLEKTLLENPDIVFKTIENNPEKFMMTVQRAAKNAKNDLERNRQLEEQKAFENSFNKPLTPYIDENTIIKGEKNAPITIVEYSDFECHFCSQGFKTVKTLMAKFPEKIRFIYKHLPLRFHDNAMIAAQYFEAIALQSPRKAFTFHDLLFKNQSKLKKGEVFLKNTAKSLKLNMKKLKNDLHSDKVTEKIEKHIAEAKKFGIHGTPGFIINGITVKGAYPPEHFERIISKLQKMGKLKL